MLLLEIPSDLADQRLWLEDQLVGPKLSVLINELVAVHEVALSKSLPTISDRSILGTVLGDRAAVFLESGLESLTQNELAVLLENPQALLELQLRIFTQDRPYWSDKIQRVRSSPRGNFHSRRQVSRRFTVALAMAASLMIAAVGLYWLQLKPAQSVASANWGWLEERDAADFKNADEYLAWISKGADAWFNKETTTAAEYQQRLEELGIGCQQLIESNHPLLSRKQAELLVARCKEWKRKFDRHAVELKENPRQFSEIKLKTDQAIRNAVFVINELRRA
jgi:hypothetical protein